MLSNYFQDVKYQNEYTEKLISAKNHFDNLFTVCDNKFFPGCGSYLFDGRKYEYCIEMYDKQKILYDKVKNSNSVLEIGTYMGHSLLIMLLANPDLKITCIDIDNTFSKPATEYLSKNFPNSEILFLNGPSLDILPNLKDKFDFFHIDGSHENDLITKEFNFCKNLNSSKSFKLIFDDAETCLPLLEIIRQRYNVVEEIIPNCKWYNTYIEINLNL